MVTYQLTRTESIALSVSPSGFTKPAVKSNVKSVKVVKEKHPVDNVSYPSREDHLLSKHFTHWESRNGWLMPANPFNKEIDFEDYGSFTAWALCMVRTFEKYGYFPEGDSIPREQIVIVGIPQVVFTLGVCNGQLSKVTELQIKEVAVYIGPIVDLNKGSNHSFRRTGNLSYNDLYSQEPKGFITVFE